MDTSRTSFLVQPIRPKNISCCAPAKRYRFRPIASAQRLPNTDNGNGLGNDQREKFFESLRKVTEAETALSNPLGLKKSYEILQFNDDIEGGPRDRYVYVEERDCIGCTHCATTATGTFFIEEEYGRARVFDQLGDNEESIELAIDTCPVNCIYYVDWRDLISLEDMRDHQVINNKGRLVGGQDHASSKVGEIKTTVMDSGIMRCANCPKRGCPECPLYGVGQNPEYLRQKAKREAQKMQRKNGTSKKPRRRL